MKSTLKEIAITKHAVRRFQVRCMPNATIGTLKEIFENNKKKYCGVQNIYKVGDYVFTIIPKEGKYVIVTTLGDYVSYMKKHKNDQPVSKQSINAIKRIYNRKKMKNELTSEIKDYLIAK